MTKIIQAILAGALGTFILDFFLFLGVYLHYIKPLGIEVYYNVLFADNQNALLYALFTILIGYLVMYTRTAVKVPIMALLFAAVFSTLIPSVGKELGERMFMKKNVTLHNKKFAFHGDIYYIGRDKITFYDRDLRKVILLDKNEIMERLDEIY